MQLTRSPLQTQAMPHKTMCIKEDLAMAYRVIARLNWDDHTYTHLSAREPSDQNAFYIYPFGLRFEETTPECLLKVSLAGEVLSGNEYQYNQTGYILHGGIYQKRPDIQAIFHLHTKESIAVSVCSQGLLPISQWALHFYNRVAYHDYDSLALSPRQGCLIADKLGEHFVMFLRHHGFITTGRTIQEAMFYCYHLQKACETQCLILASGGSDMRPNQTTCEKASSDLLSFEKNLGKRDWEAWKRWDARQTRSDANN